MNDPIREALAASITTSRALCADLGAQAFAEYADLLPGFTQHHASLSMFDGLHHFTHRRGDEAVNVHHMYGTFSATMVLDGKRVQGPNRTTARAAVEAMLAAGGAS